MSKDDVFVIELPNHGKIYIDPLAYQIYTGLNNWFDTEDGTVTATIRFEYKKDLISGIRNIPKQTNKDI